MNKLLNTTNTWFEIKFAINCLSNSLQAHAKIKKFYMVKCLVNFNVANCEINVYCIVGKGGW